MTRQSQRLASKKQSARTAAQPTFQLVSTKHQAEDDTYQYSGPAPTELERDILTLERKRALTREATETTHRLGIVKMADLSIDNFKTNQATDEICRVYEKLRGLADKGRRNLNGSYTACIEGDVPESACIVLSQRFKNGSMAYLVDEGDDPLHMKSEFSASKISDEDQYELRGISHWRIKDGSTQYLVQWKGYPNSNDDTWEPGDNLPQELLRQFLTSALGASATTATTAVSTV